MKYFDIRWWQWIRYKCYAYHQRRQGKRVIEFYEWENVTRILAHELKQVKKRLKAMKAELKKSKP